MPPSSRQREGDLANSLAAPLLDSDQDSAGSAPRPRPALHVVRDDASEAAAPQSQASRPGLAKGHHAGSTEGAPPSSRCFNVQGEAEPLIDARCRRAGPDGAVHYDPRPRHKTLRTARRVA